MKRKPIESTCIDEAGYDEKTKTLEVRLTFGKLVYRYKDVSPLEYSRFMAAESKGQFFNSIIKRHDYELVTE